MADLTTRSPAGLMKDFVVRYLNGINPTYLNGWTWSLGTLPNLPDQVISFIDQAGMAGLPSLLVDYPGLQLLVRSAPGGTGYNDSWLMARMIRDAILGMDGHPNEFVELDSVTERGTLVSLGYDAQVRHVWSCNFQLIIEPGVSAISHRASL